MATWDFNELRKLCSEKRIPDSRVYQHSLAWRWYRADFHSTRYKEVWQEILDRRILFDNQFHELIFSCESHIEACIQCLHALGDILAQIINLAILHGKYDEGQVTLSGVMKDSALPGEIAESLERLKESDEYKYVEAFCNIIKHRQLIPSQFRLEYGKDYRNDMGIRFDSFDYKGTSFPQAWSSDIVDGYAPTIRNLIIEVGQTITKVLQEKED